jgi:hypothetical protein
MKKMHSGLAAGKIVVWNKIGNSGVKPANLKYCQWRPTSAPQSRNGVRDNASGIMIKWGTSPPCILQIHSLHQVATGAPSHVLLRCCGIIITTFHGIGTNCIVPSDWDWAPKRVCGPNYRSYLIGTSPIFPAASGWPENVDCIIWVLTGSSSTITEIAEYTYFSLIETRLKLKHKSE